MGLLAAANNSVGVNFLTKNFQNASLDHAMWFHRKLDLDGWFLYTIDSPITRNARGFSKGINFFKRWKTNSIMHSRRINTTLEELIFSDDFS